MKNLALGVLLAVATLLVGSNLAAAQSATSCYVFNNDLSYGMTFGEVLELQKFLAADGSFNVELTGSFGPLTRAALAQYQAKNGIQATGYFGPQTRAFVNSRGCGQVLGAYDQVAATTVTPKLKGGATGLTKTNAKLPLKIVTPSAGDTWQLPLDKDGLRQSGGEHTISWSPDPDSTNVDAFFEIKEKGVFKKVAQLVQCAKGSIVWCGDIDVALDGIVYDGSDTWMRAAPGKYYLSIVDRVSGESTRTRNPIKLVEAGSVIKLNLKAHIGKERIVAEANTSITVPEPSIVLSWNANATTCTVQTIPLADNFPQEHLLEVNNLKRHGTRQSFDLLGGHSDYRVYLSCGKGSNWQTKSYLVTVEGAENLVPINVISPNGGEKFAPGEVIDIEWTTEGITSNVALHLYGGNLNEAIVLGYNLPNTGKAKVTIPDSAPSGSYKLQVVPHPRNLSGTSDDYFTIEEPGITVTSPDDGSVYDNGPDQNIGVSWEEYEGNFDYYRVGFHNHKAQVGGLISGPINKNSNGYSFKSKVVTDFVEDLSGKTWPKEGYQMVVYAIKVDSAGEGTVAQGSSGTFEIWHSERSDLSITEIYGFPNQQKGILTAGGSARIYGEYDGLDGDFSGVLEGKDYNVSFEADKSFANALTANIPSNVPAGRYDFYVQHDGVNSNRLDVQVVGGNGILCQFTRDLTLGSTGEDVRNLQNHLVSKGFLAAQTSQWSGYFGVSTQEALARYQDSFGMSPAVGYFGPVTRAYMAANDPCYEVLEPETGMILVEDVSVDSDSEDGIGTFTYEIELTAFDEDIYIPTSSGHSTDNAGFDWTIVGGLATSTITVQSDADIVGSNFILEEGDTETFTIVITVDPLQSGSYYAILDDVTFDDGATLTPPQTFDFEPTSMFDTPAVSVTMSAGPQPTPSARVAANTAAYSHISTIPNLSVGSTDPGVAAIQRFLNANGFTVNTVAGQPGSVGYESTTFGPATQRALAAFQASRGISPANGSFGPQTRAAMSQ